MSKKVVFVTRRDYANMFYRLYTAINRYTEYEVVHVTKEANPKYGIQCQYCINFATDIEMRKIMEKIRECDLAVVSDDFFRLEYLNDLPSKKIVYTGSSHYRREHRNIKEKYKNLGVKRVVISTPDLVLNGDEIYIPAPFDAINTGKCQRGLKDMTKKTKKGKNATLHPTQKPLELYKHLISVSSKENDLVCDPFVGTGTANVACRLLNRYCIGIELNDNYVQHAIKRLKKVKLKNQKTGIKDWS